MTHQTSSPQESVPQRDMWSRWWSDYTKLSAGVVISGLLIASALAMIYGYRSWLVAATVDGRPISRFAIIDDLEDESGKTVLDSLINQKLIENEAKRQNIKVDREAIRSSFQEIESQATAQGGTLDEALKEHGLTRDDLE